jgi:Ca2+:H+ antiporter
VGSQNTWGESIRSWIKELDPYAGRGAWFMLSAVPLAAGLALADAPAVAQFALAGVAIIPLAGMIGNATEVLACRLGPTIGGLLNATFGNAAELIIALFALFRGLDDVVKASLAGSVIGNLLLVLGASLTAGGLRHHAQHFNRTKAGAGATLMVLAAIGLLIPAIFHGLVGPGRGATEQALSVAVCVVLILTYGLSLVFSLVTHRDIDVEEPTEVVLGHTSGGDEPLCESLVLPMTVLLGATLLVAWMSEILVGAVEEASVALGLTKVFVGVIVVAVVGNAAEHATAVVMAWKNQADLAVNIALSSALQIALFVAPVLVFASYARSVPMNLLFSTLEVAAVLLAVLVARMVAEDGESNWLEGAMLLMLYVLIALSFYYLPPMSGVTPQHALTM